MSEQHGEPRRRSRRGILAAAGSMIAAIAARQAAQPVGATHQPEDLGLGLDNFASDITTLTYTGGSLSAGHAAFRVGDSSLMPTSGPSAALAGFAISTPIGSGGAVTTGVYGATTDVTGAGVYGECIAAGGIGVQAKTPAGGFGLYTEGGYGVVSTGLGNGGIALLGEVGSNLSNTYGVYGSNTATGTGNFGVAGTAAAGTGVFGRTNASYQYGVLGQTTAASSTAIAGTCTGNGSSAFSGGTTNPNAFAGFFQGKVVVQGDLAVTGNKSAVVQHPRTGDHRLVYCVESPESWFEDFGEGILAGGTATVTLDPDFAALIHTEVYYVFLTEYGGNNALYVDKRSATEFTVRADRPGASGTFAWRVVGKRADVKGERLGKFTMPNLPLPDVSKFTAPEIPTPAVPQKKP